MTASEESESETQSSSDGCYRTTQRHSTTCLQSGATAALMNHICVKQNPKLYKYIDDIKDSGGNDEHLHHEYGAAGPNPKEYVWKNV